MNAVRRDADDGRMRREAGFALIAALGFGLALAAVAAGVTRDARATLREAAGAEAAARARAAAEAGIARASALLVRSAADREALADALEPWSHGAWRFDGVEVVLSASLERGRVDLNAAAPALLEAAARAAGHPDAAAFAAQVAARRDALAAAGVPWRIDARPFDDVAQARAFAPASTWPALAPLLTVRGGAVPDLVAAPAALVAELGSGLDARIPERGPDLRPGDLARLRVAARGPDGAGASIEALVALPASGSPEILLWRPAPTF